MSNLIQKIRQIIFIDQGQEAFIKKGMSGTFVMEIVARLLLFGTTLILTNILSPEDYGKYSYYIGWIITMATIGTFGLDDFLIRKLGHSDQSSAFQSNRGAIITSFLIIMIISVLFYASERSIVGIQYFALASVFLTVQWMISSILKGRKHVLSAQFSEQIIRTGIFFISILGLTILGSKLSFLHIAQLVCLAAFASLVSSLVLLFKKENLSVIFPKGSFNFLWKKEIAFFAALSFFGVFRHKLDVLILGSNDLLVETGIYNIASKLSDLILVGLVITTAVYMPLFAGQNERKDSFVLQKMLRSSALINAILGSLLFICFLFFGSWILSWFGEEYPAGYNALIILSISTWIYAILGPYIIMLMMLGYAGEVLIGLVLGVTVQATLAIILIPNAPIEGMALAKGISIIVIQLFMLFIAWKRLGLLPFFIPRKN